MGFRTVFPISCDPYDDCFCAKKKRDIATTLWFAASCWHSGSLGGSGPARQRSPGSPQRGQTAAPTCLHRLQHRQRAACGCASALVPQHGMHQCSPPSRKSSTAAGLTNANNTNNATNAKIHVQYGTLCNLIQTTPPLTTTKASRRK